MVSLIYFCFLADAEETDFDICSQVQAGTLEASRPESNNSQVVPKEHEDLCKIYVLLKLCQTIRVHSQMSRGKYMCMCFFCYH